MTRQPPKGRDRWFYFQEDCSFLEQVGEDANMSHGLSVIGLNLQIHR
jgi:hypothetical protein